MRTPVVGVLCCLLAACRPATPAPIVESDVDTDVTITPDPGLDFEGFTAKNVVIVNVDTLRADTLPMWGGARDTTPRLKLRGSWITVNQAISTSSWTAPATASQLTGRDQHTHGIQYTDLDGRLNGPIASPSFATWLGEHQIVGGLFSGNTFLEQAELAAGFAHVEVDRTERLRAGEMVDDALAWIDGLPSEQRFMAWLQPMDVHEPFNPPAEDLGTWSDPTSLPFDLTADAHAQEAQIEAALAGASLEERDRVFAQVRAVYDEEMLAVDRAIDALIAGLEARGRGADTLVVVTADHGETIGDGDGPDQRVGHGRSLRHELVRVPLMFRVPGSKGGQETCLASSMDLFPTVLDAMDVAPMASDGMSLLTGCRDHAFSTAYAYNGESVAMSFLGVESPTSQLVFDCIGHTTRAWNLAADPGARRPVPVSSLQDGEALSAALVAQAAVIAEVLPVTCQATGL